MPPLAPRPTAPAATAADSIVALSAIAVSTPRPPRAPAPAVTTTRPRLGALIAVGSLLWLSACSDQNYDVRPEAPVLGADSLAVLSVPEDAALETVLRVLSPADPAPYTREGLSYQFVPGTDAGPFAIARSSGELRLTGALDYESQNRYVLPVRINYRSVHSLAEITVEITDVHDPLSLLADDDADSTVSTDSVIEVNAADSSERILADVSTMIRHQSGLTPRYAIVAGNDGGHFAIDATSGQLTAVSAAAFASSADIVNLRVRITRANERLELPLMLRAADTLYFAPVPPPAPPP